MYGKGWEICTINLIPQDIYCNNLTLISYIEVHITEYSKMEMYSSTINGEKLIIVPHRIACVVCKKRGDIWKPRVPKKELKKEIKCLLFITSYLLFIYNSYLFVNWKLCKC